MTQALWSEVDHYIQGALLPQDPALEAALAASTAAGLPAINVSPPQGKLLMLLAQMLGAKSILEIGTLGGYSTIWLARGLLDGGRVVTLEADAKHAEVARKNIAHAGFASAVDVRTGRALETLPGIAAEGIAPFDLFFLDADKVSNADYFAWSIKLARVGSVIIVDNVIRNGAVADATSQDANVLGVRRLNDLIAKEPRVVATSIQTVGSKGYDGFTLARVVSL